MQHEATEPQHVPELFNCAPHRVDKTVLEHICSTMGRLRLCDGKLVLDPGQHVDELVVIDLKCVGEALRVDNPFEVLAFALKIVDYVHGTVLDSRDMSTAIVTAISNTCIEAEGEHDRVWQCYERLKRCLSRTRKTTC